jgi:hypothetical protein
MKVGQKVSWNSSGGTASGIIRAVVTDGKVSGIPVKVSGSKEEPAARIEITDKEGKPTGTMVGHKISTLRKSDVAKEEVSTDVFSTKVEAVSRSLEMGLGNTFHTTEVNSQEYYMPAASHDAYVAFTKGSDLSNQDSALEERLETVKALGIEGKILKTDDEQRLVYGWASVVTEFGEPVVDRQGDVIGTDTLVKAVNEFMEHVRVGKAMHTGEQVGVVVHSLPVTSEICNSLGIQSDREGWIVAYKVYDDDVWAMVKSGELAAFSIGGRATKEEL